MPKLFTISKRSDWDDENVEGSQAASTAAYLRVKKLTELAQKMDNAQGRAGELKSASENKTASSGRVKDLVKFHEDRQAISAGKIQEALAEAISVKRWLARQRAVFNEDGTIDEDSSKLAVKYDQDLISQELTRVVVKGGRLWMHSANETLDTSRMSTMFSGPRFAIYVMSAEGHLHVANHVAGSRHHSSLLNGEPVAGAGEIQAFNGVLKVINNKSGHYWPLPFHLWQVLKELERQGLPMSGFTVTTVTAPQERGTVYGIPKKFLDKERAPPTPVLTELSERTPEQLATMMTPDELSRMRKATSPKRLTEEDKRRGYASVEVESSDDDDDSSDDDNSAADNYITVQRAD
jgi:hypothetical protein